MLTQFSLSSGKSQLSGVVGFFFIMVLFYTPTIKILFHGAKSSGPSTVLISIVMPVSSLFYHGLVFLKHHSSYRICSWMFELSKQFICTGSSFIRRSFIIWFKMRLLCRSGSTDLFVSAIHVYNSLHSSLINHQKSFCLHAEVQPSVVFGNSIGSGKG